MAGSGTEEEERAMAEKRTKFVLDESRIPRVWYNIAADLPTPPAPVLHPGTGQPIGPADLAPLFPMALIGQEVSTEREIEIPGPGTRRLCPLPAVAALSRPPPGSGAPDAGPHLLQVRGCQSGRQPQAQHGHRPGVLQQGRGREAPGDRDRRRPVGHGPRVRRCALRPRGQGLHGARQLRPEAVPARADGGLRRGGRGQPQPDHRLRRAGPGGGPRQPRIARHRHLARPSRTRPSATTRSTPWARC